MFENQFLDMAGMAKCGYSVDVQFEKAVRIRFVDERSRVLAQSRCGVEMCEVFFNELEESVIILSAANPPLPPAKSTSTQRVCEVLYTYRRGK